MCFDVYLWAKISEESRPYNTQVISALSKGYITSGFIRFAICGFK